jgi:isopenicillin N synthase-like dioxygenase
MEVIQRLCYLQVEAWHPCPHIPGCITVNIGDALQAYSDGMLKSNFHRVRMPKPDEPQVGVLFWLSSHACVSEQLGPF